MRRAIVKIAACLLVLSALFTLALAAQRYQVVRVASDDVLNLRALPDPGAPILGTIAPNATDVIGTGRFAPFGNQRWAEVVHRGLTGWVNAQFLSPIAETSEPASTRTFRVIGVASNDVLNMRAMPGAKQNIVGAIPFDGRGVLALGESATIGTTIWWKVRYEERTGWVNAAYLTPEIAAGEASAIDAAKTSQQTHSSALAQPLAIPIETPEQAGGLEGPRVALVIGNGNYRPETGVSSLPNAANDGRSMAEALRGLGFNVIELLDADQKIMQAGLTEFGIKAAGAEIAMVFYAGHGMQVNGENYLLPVSARVSQHEDVMAQSVSLSEIMAATAEESPKLTLIVLDACRNNPLTGKLAEAARSRGLPDLNIRPGLARAKGRPGMLIAFSTDPDNVAADGQGVNSPFTEALLKEMRKPEIEIRLMFGEVRAAVVAATSGSQTPWVEEAVLGQFYFRPPPKIRTERFLGDWIEEHYTLTVEKGSVTLSLPPYAEEPPRIFAAGSKECQDLFEESYAVIPVSDLPLVLTDPETYAWARQHSQGKSLLVMSIQCGYASHRLYLLLTEFQKLLFVEFSEQDFRMRQEFYRTPR